MSFRWSRHSSARSRLLEPGGGSVGAASGAWICSRPKSKPSRCSWNSCEKSGQGVTDQAARRLFSESLTLEWLAPFTQGQGLSRSSAFQRNAEYLRMKAPWAASPRPVNSNFSLGRMHRKRREIRAPTSEIGGCLPAYRCQRSLDSDVTLSSVEIPPNEGGARLPMPLRAYGHSSLAILSACAHEDTTPPLRGLVSEVRQIRCDAIAGCRSRPEQNT